MSMYRRTQSRQNLLRQHEVADIHPPDAEGLAQFLPQTDCGRCGFAGCLEFAEALIGKQVNPAQCSVLDHELSNRLTAILVLNKEPIPFNIMMEQVPCTLLEINNPDRNSPLLITSNFRETVRLMTEILEGTVTPAFLLPTFTHGYSVDNAVHERMFKAVEIWKALKENELEERINRTVMIIPGLADQERYAIRQITGWEVLVGPISGFLTPLFILNHRDAFL